MPQLSVVIEKGMVAWISFFLTMQHLIHRAHQDDSMSWFVSVDFSKAIDHVQRNLMLEHCANLGIHGPSMQALCMMYDNINMQVQVNGRLGEAFET